MINECAKIKNQYTDKQWSKLCSDPEFKKVWDSKNYILASEIANRLVEGNETNIKDARLQTQINRAVGDLLT